MESINSKLDSSFVEEKIDALRRIVALSSQGKDCKDYFANVVKNSSSSNSTIRTLVYLLLLEYALVEPDLCLLSINSFLKDLKDSDQFTRMQSLRVLSSIQLEIIAPVTLNVLKTASRDMSHHVRRACGNALSKFQSSQAYNDQLIEIAQLLLDDKAPVVVASAISSVFKIFPDRIDLLHSYYRKLCKLLSQVDEWNQIQILNILLNYCRTCFLKPTDMNLLDPDIQLFLDYCMDLIYSSNEAVLFTIAKVFYYILDGLECSSWPLIAERLVYVTASTLCNEQRQILLQNIATLAIRNPVPFIPHLQHFFISSIDPFFVAEVKLDLIAIFVDQGSFTRVLRELKVSLM